MEHSTEPAEAGEASEAGDPQFTPGTHAGEARAGAGVASEGAAPGTGEPRVDAALRLLDRLPGLPVSEHPELFEQVHAQLTEVLGELDSGPGGPAGQQGS